MVQKYSLNDKMVNVSEMLELGTEEEVFIEWIDKPENIRVIKVSNIGIITLSFTSEQERVLDENGFKGEIVHKVLFQKKGNGDGKEYTLWEDENENFYSFVPDFLEAETTYTVKVMAELKGERSEWSKEVEFTTSASPEFSECVWKACPGNALNKGMYLVGKVKQRIATNWGYDFDFDFDFDSTLAYSNYYCTIIGNAPLPKNKVTSWSIKILNSKRSNGNGICIGIAPFDIDQNEDNYDKCGWYFSCVNSTLWSGPPHNHRGKEYGPRKEDGKYVHTGDSVGVVMDTTKGELSFVVNGVNLGVAYEGIPLDKPLVPCVVLTLPGDSVELII